MNQHPTKEVNAGEFLDFSHGSNNTYLVEARHRLIPGCIHCRRFIPVLFDGTEYYQYFVQGKFRSVAEAFPALTREQHEVIISGTHPECWFALFAGEE